MSRLTLRLSPALRARLDQAGEASAAARGLIALGLIAAGDDPADWRAELAGALAALDDGPLAAALAGALACARDKTPPADRAGGVVRRAADDRQTTGRPASDAAAILAAALETPLDDLDLGIAV